MNITTKISGVVAAVSFLLMMTGLLCSAWYYSADYSDTRIYAIMFKTGLCILLPSMYLVMVFMGIDTPEERKLRKIVKQQSKDYD